MIWALVIKGLLPKRHTQKGSPRLDSIYTSYSRFLHQNATNTLSFTIHHHHVLFFKERVKSCTCLVIRGHDNNIEKNKLGTRKFSSLLVSGLVLSDNKYGWYIFVSLFLYLQQFSSSLPSEHSGLPEHCK